MNTDVRSWVGERVDRDQIDPEYNMLVTSADGPFCVLPQFMPEGYVARQRLISLLAECSAVRGVTVYFYSQGRRK